jgi:hypothetical protein
LAFGTLSVLWELVDDTPPEAMAVNQQGEHALLVGGMIAIPPSDKPLGAIYLTASGTWLLECPNQEVRPIANADVFDLDGQTWRFFCPGSAVTKTLLVKGTDIREARAIFTVSPDEEHVSLALSDGSKVVDLGARAHNYLLLTLARRRMKDSSDGVPASSCGWTHQEELARALRTDPEHINVDIFRLRRRLSEFFVNAGQVVERRTGTGQLRIGIASIEVLRS